MNRILDNGGCMSDVKIEKTPSLDQNIGVENSQYRKALPGTGLEYFDAREAVDAISPGSYKTLPYTSRVLAEQLVRRCDPETLEDSLKQIIERKSDLDFPWYPARVVCHDILGQTALVDLAGLRDAIADQGGDPAKVNPVVETQLIVDHSLAVEHAGFDSEAFDKNRAIEERRNEDRFHFIEWCKTAFKNVSVIPAGNGIMHQINLEKMSPVIQSKQGIAFPSRDGNAWSPFDDAFARYRGRKTDWSATRRHYRNRYCARNYRVSSQ